MRLFADQADFHEVKTKNPRKSTKSVSYFQGAAYEAGLHTHLMKHQFTYCGQMV